MATNKSKSKRPSRRPQAAVSDSSRHQDCALCLEQYKSPRILPCFHTFCLTCLERLTQNSPRTGSFPCPTCRTSVQIPQGGVGKFQVNFYVEAAIESMQSGQGANARLCDMCGTQNATSKCVDCDQFACDNCTAIHARIGAARSHTVLNLNAQNQASPTVMRERYCSTHKDEKVRFFCSQCNCLLCRDCKLTTHEGHPTTDLSQRSQAAKNMLLNVTKTAHTSLTPKLKNSLKRAEKHKADLVTKKTQIRATFRQRAEEIKKTVDTCLKEAEENLEVQAGGLEKNVAQTIDDMQQQIACLESLCSHAEQVVKSGCDADILSLPSQMVEFFGGNPTLASNPQVFGHPQTVDADMQQQFACLDSYEEPMPASADILYFPTIKHYPLPTDEFFEGNASNSQVFGHQSQMILGPYSQYDQYGYTDLGNSRLQVFTNENWRETIQLIDSTTGNFFPGYGYGQNLGQTNQLKPAISQQFGTVQRMPVEAQNQVLGGYTDEYSNRRCGSRQRLIRPNRQQQQQPFTADSEEVDIAGISQEISQIQRLVSGWA